MPNFVAYSADAALQGGTSRSIPATNVYKIQNECLELEQISNDCIDHYIGQKKWMNNLHTITSSQFAPETSGQLSLIPCVTSQNGMGCSGHRWY